MGIEIERKFLIFNDNWQENISNSYHITQGYINREPVVRIRTINDEKAFITIKTKIDHMSSNEYEYEIPCTDAKEMLSFSQDIIIKTRNIIPCGEHTIEVDVFGGKLEGLVMAEIELSNKNENPILPGWLNLEVTGDTNFSNNNLLLRKNIDFLGDYRERWNKNKKTRGTVSF